MQYAANTNRSNATGAFGSPTFKNAQNRRLRFGNGSLVKKRATFGSYRVGFEWEFDEWVGLASSKDVPSATD